MGQAQASTEVQGLKLEGIRWLPEGAGGGPRLTPEDSGRRAQGAV